jgi:hypothetical protein
MNMRSRFALLAWLMPVFLPAAAWAEAGVAYPAGEVAIQVSAPAMQPCPAPGNPKLNLAETSQTDCCKGHKGICGCRAGKIVCCDGTASPNCTCHGEEGFIE